MHAEHMGELHREAASFEDVLLLSSAGVYWAPLASDKRCRSVKLLAAREDVNADFTDIQRGIHPKLLGFDALMMFDQSEMTPCQLSHESQDLLLLI